MESQEDESHSTRSGCPVLVTERLVLRTPHIEDTDALACLANNARVATMVSRMPHPYTRKDATDFIRRANTGAIGKCVYAVTDADAGRFLGCCGIEPQDDPVTLELGYWLGRAHWGKGLGTEAATAVVDHARRTLDGMDIYAGHDADNHASARVLAKLGFVAIGRSERPCKALGVTRPEVELRLTAA